eukprot:360848-Chlamydomonas_euryale.AAC.3
MYAAGNGKSGERIQGLEHRTYGTYTACTRTPPGKEGVAGGDKTVKEAGTGHASSQSLCELDKSNWQASSSRCFASSRQGPASRIGFLSNVWKSQRGCE